MSGASLQHVDLCVDQELEGWLERARRRTGPYKRRWFVLAGGLLYQYKTPTAPDGAWCRFCRHSFLSLVGAEITKGGVNLLQIKRDKKKLFLRASCAEEHKAWLAALQQASDRHYDNSSVVSTPTPELQNSLSQQYTESVLMALAASFDELERHSEISKRHAAELQEYLVQRDSKEQCEQPRNHQILERKLKVFDLSAKVVMQSSEDLLDMARKHKKSWEACVMAAGMGRGVRSVCGSGVWDVPSARSSGPFHRRNSSFVWSQRTGFVEVFDDKEAGDDVVDDVSKADEQEEFLDAVDHLERHTENQCTIL